MSLLMSVVKAYLQHNLSMSFLLVVSCLNGSDGLHVEGKRLMPAGTQCPDATNHIRCYSSPSVRRQSSRCSGLLWLVGAVGVPLLLVLASHPHA